MRKVFDRRCVGEMEDGTSACGGMGGEKRWTIVVAVAQ